MKVIKQGNLTSIKSYTFVCPKCGCEFSLNEVELENDFPSRYQHVEKLGDFKILSLNCPCCEKEFKIVYDSTTDKWMLATEGNLNIIANNYRRRKNEQKQTNPRNNSHLEIDWDVITIAIAVLLIAISIGLIVVFA